MAKKPFKKDSKEDKGFKGSRNGRNSKFRDKKRVDFMEGETRSKPNDWHWYAQNEYLLKSSANMPYSWPLGMNLNLGPNAPEVNKGSVAGICVIHTSPTFGWSIDPNSPVNTAARMVYTFVRHENSGHTNYDSPDLMLYLLGVDSLYSFHAWMRRVYGTINLYAPENRYLSKPLVEAEGVDFENIKKNLADFNLYINHYATQISKFAVPVNMPYNAKHTWMYSGMYLDSDQPKAQTYFFNPHGFYKFELQNEAGALKFKELLPIPTHYPTDERKLLTFQDIIAYGDEILAPISASEDFHIMSGDVLKAYKNTGCALPPMTDIGYKVAAVFDNTVLDQIQNASLIGEWAFPPSILQDNTKSYLIFNPQFTHPYTFEPQGGEFPGQNVFISNRIVTFNHGEVTPAETMEATRLTNICTEFEEAGTSTYLCRTLGSEVAHAATLYWNYRDDESGNASRTTWSNPIFIGLTHVVDIKLGSLILKLGTALYNQLTNDGISITQAQVRHALSVVFSSSSEMNDWWNEAVASVRQTLMQDARLVQQLSQFDRHPPVAITTGIQGDEHMSKPSGYGRYIGQLLDVNNNTIVDEHNLMNMTDTALMSEFNVVDNGKWS